MKYLQELCIKKHYEYGFGIVLNRELHNEFHGIYGNKANTKEQFIEFAKSKGIVNIENIIIKELKLA